MLVKWERKRLRSRGKDRGFLLEAFLVQAMNERVPAGEKGDACLGSIEERFLKAKESGVRAFHQGLFWTNAVKRLGELKIGEPFRKRIERELLEVVKKPEPDWSLWCVKCIPKYDES